MTRLPETLRRHRRMVPAIVVASLALVLPPATAGPAAATDSGSLLQLAQANYRYRASPNRNYTVRPSPPYYQYRPRVRVPGAPETRLEYGPSYRSKNRYRRAPTDRGSRELRRRGLKSRRGRCLRSRPTHPGSNTRVYGLSRNCR